MTPAYDDDRVVIHQRSIFDILPAEFRWASTSGIHTMPHPDELRWLGYELVQRDGEPVTDPRYYGSLLMWRSV